MNAILQHITAEQFRAITSGNTKREIDSLVWVIEHMPEHLRGVYLNCFLGGSVTQEINDFFYSRGEYAKTLEAVAA